MSSRVIKSIQHHKSSNIHLFFTYATFFGHRQVILQQYSVKGKMRKRPILYIIIHPEIIIFLYHRRNNKIQGYRKRWTGFETAIT